MASIKVPALILSLLPPIFLPSCIVVSVSLVWPRVPEFTFISYCELAMFRLRSSRYSFVLSRLSFISPRSNHLIPSCESNGHNRLAVTLKEKEDRFNCYFPFLDGHFTSHRYDWSVVIRFWQCTRWEKSSTRFYLRQRDNVK